MKKAQSEWLLLMNAQLCGLIFMCSKTIQWIPNEKELVTYPIKMSTIRIWKLSTQNANAFQKYPQTDNPRRWEEKRKSAYTANKSVFQISKCIFLDSKFRHFQSSPRFYHQIKVASLGKSNWHLKWKSYIH